MTDEQIQKLCDAATKLDAHDIYYLRSANRKCGLSYKSACRRNGGIEVAKNLKQRGLLHLHDRGEHVTQSRFRFFTTLEGRKALEEAEKKK